VLQGKSEQGMPSLSYLPVNEVLATASCGSDLLYPKHVTVLKIYTYKTIHFRYTWRWFMTCSRWHI
jgi:hypothetical protein